MLPGDTQIMRQAHPRTQDKLMSPTMVARRGKLLRGKRAPAAFRSLVDTLSARRQEPSAKTPLAARTLKNISQVASLGSTYARRCGSRSTWVGTTH